MTITQYSKIQNRRGLLTDLPNPLEPSELGHVLDERRLFIGNGSTSDGSPVVGNTEILTEFSDNTSLIKYTYKSNTGVDAISGPDANTPVIRSLQQVLDDKVSIKAYGAEGNGMADDSTVINRALEDIYTVTIPVGAQEQAYRAIYFPAGRYILNTTQMYLPPYTILLGDGIGKTVIEMKDTGDTQTSAVRTADSDFQTDLQLGNGGATLPTNIVVQGISFIHDKDKTVISLDRTSNVLFDTCSFHNGWDGSSVTTTTLINIDPIGSVYTHSNIKFINCEFSGSSVANINATGIDAHDIIFDNCRFLDLFQGIIANNVSGDVIDGLKVVNSHFENIARTCIYASPYAQGIGSNSNTFVNCGDIGYPVIKFDKTGSNTAIDCSSINDSFSLGVGVVSVDNLSKTCLVLNPQTDFIFKNVTITSKADPFTIQPGQTNTSSNISFNTTLTDSMFIDYTLKRGGFSRIGRIFVATDGTTTGTAVSDLFTESDTTGVTFGFNISGSTLTLVYTSASVIAIGTIVNPNVTPGDTLVINGVTVTLTGTSLTSTIIDINTASVPFLTADDNNGKLQLLLDAGPNITITGTGTAMADLGLSASYSSTSGEFHHQDKSWSML